MDKVEIYLEKCHKNAIIPTYANDGDAGMDVYAVEDVEIEEGKTKIVKTGLKMIIPKGYEIQVRPRSGLSFKKKLRIANSPGTIDSGYRDEIGIIVENTSCVWEGRNGGESLALDSKAKSGIFRIKKGDRIAQFVLSKVPVAEFKIVDSVKDFGEKDRGGGFGSTGIGCPSFESSQGYQNNA